MSVEGGPTRASPSVAATSSPSASQENDQAQANSASVPHGLPSMKQQDITAPDYAAGYVRRGGVGGFKRGSLKGRGRNKLATGLGAGSGLSGAATKFVSPDAVLDAARRVKDSLPDLSPELLASLRARGLEPCTLKEVLEERGLQWAATQVRDERAESEHKRLLEAFQRQCKGWGNNREGWVHRKWHSVIVCPDFKRGGLQVSRSSMREMWNSIMSVVHGFVNPDLVVCRVTDPTHPVRFATPPGESCFTVVYAGKGPMKASKERRILGEYTGHVRAGSTNKQRFEYVFDLSFCALAWRAAEEFEKESDSSGEEGPSTVSKVPAPASQEASVDENTELHKKAKEDVVSNEGVRRVQVTGSSNIKRVALPVRGELVLDSHDACNQMSLVNHYGTIGLLGEKICHCNTEWQQVFVDGWPHIVLTTIPGVAIEPGEEVLADFGYDWFNRVQDVSHKAIARELLDYRIGVKTGGCQTLAPARNAECLVRDNDASLQTRARIGEVCPYCHSDEIPLVPGSVATVSVDLAVDGCKSAAGKHNTEKKLELAKTQGPRKAGAADMETNDKASIWGEQVVHCDGCDRPCHLRCIFGAHAADRRQQEQREQGELNHNQKQEQHDDQKNGEQAEQQFSEKQQEQQSPEQLQGQQPREQQQKQRHPDHRQEQNYQKAQQNQKIGELKGFQSNCCAHVASSDAPTNGRETYWSEANFGVVTGGETVEDIYRWFVEGDYKWFCCVCRLQWERMAAAMNFSVDWQARRVLREGNPLLLHPSNEVITKSAVTSKIERAGSGPLNITEEVEHASSAVSDICGNRRRGPGARWSDGTGIPKRRKRTAEGQVACATGSKDTVCVGTVEENHQGGALPTKTEQRSRQETDGSVSQGSRTDTTGCTLGAEAQLAASVAPYSAYPDRSASEAFKRSVSNTPLSGPQPEYIAAASDEVSASLPMEGSVGTLLCTGRSIEAIEKDGRTLPVHTLEPTDEGCSADGDPSLSAEVRGNSGHGNTSGPVRGSDSLIVEPMRVYKNSSEKSQTSKMQPCPVSLTPDEFSGEELLGCRTEMLVEPRTLLGALQPCVRCYKLYGSKASVEVCRLTKRHLASNWDHPHFASPAQIQDALLTCFQDALLTVQREHREKLRGLLDSMSPLQRGESMNSFLGDTRHPRIHENAARRSAENTLKPEIRTTEVVTKGAIPLISVTLGKTRVDYKFPCPKTKKPKWFYGLVSNYQAVSTTVQDVEPHLEGKSTRIDGPGKGGTGSKEFEKERTVTYFTNQFRIDYDDGDFQTVPPHELIEMLIETGPGSKLDGRKAITTTPLTKMLSPELKRANRQVNQLVRETNKKGCTVNSDLDTDDE
ncbi:chypothetical protein, conserved, putative [Eimeria necatrix]|uniref:SET domain-containing protein n=1 Tax=Eimeria necatrix TaxID=51315 RepID=U6N6X9_9EIME|nr:chypothetical protein, conserved, putative [Eimeria necatrix]CDJ69651.1 chypothetical protein, conserved, putative [Eimeria necatrix]